MTALRVAGTGTPRLLDPPGPHAVGRDTSSTVTVADLRVSRHHGDLFHDGIRWWYRDTSTAGSFVRSERVTTVALDTPTVVALGAPDGPPIRLEPADTPPAGAPIRVGRDPDNDVVIEDLTVSRHHATVRRGEGGWEIADLGSQNGTFVDGQRVELVPLCPDDEVAVGGHRFRFDGAGLVAVDDAGAPAIAVDRLTVTTVEGVSLLASVSFTVPPASFVAIVGPTGAGKSTLLRALTGVLPPSRGAVRLRGRDLYAWYDALRAEIGYVPQDDIVHLALTARQALEFGAELRFPPDTSAEERSARVATVLAELGLDAHADKAISRLSGGQRKRVSVALELLTEPALLFLDEPTSGLDPGYEQTLMELLRSLADGGRTVLVVTHSIASLNLCDAVIFLATGGHVAYAGPPQRALAHFGTDSYPDVFRSLERLMPAPSAATEPPSLAAPEAPRQSDRPAPDVRSQVRTLSRRAAALVLADRRNPMVLAAAALVPGMLLAILLGGSLRHVREARNADARTMIGALVVAACVLGVANGAREIVREQAIYRRERAVGLSRAAYLGSKILVLGAVTVGQILVLLTVATAGAGGPGNGNLLPGRIELLLDVAAGGVASVALGLLVSSIVTSSEKAGALVPAAFVVLWLFSGAVTNLVDKPVLRDVAYLAPSNWAMAASANTADLATLERCGAAPPAAPAEASNSPSSTAPTTAPASPAAPACDRRWHHSFGSWVLALAMLTAIGAAALLGADWALARREPIAADRRRYLVADAVRSLAARLR